MSAAQQTLGMMARFLPSLSSVAVQKGYNKHLYNKDYYCSLLRLSVVQVIITRDQDSTDETDSG